MIRLGRTYSNLMVTVEQTNGKLSERAVRILADATGCDPGRCRQVLASADGNLPAALLMLLGGLSLPVAVAALERAGGSVRLALNLIPETPTPDRNRKE
jgi:N-acetylmuramic acid 6-phosphate etherase